MGRMYKMLPVKSIQQIESANCVNEDACE